MTFDLKMSALVSRRRLVVMCHVCHVLTVCLPPMIETNCVCERTCSNIDKVTCYEYPSPHCARGCQCPGGMIMHDGKCVTEETCPCIYKGKSYEVGILSLAFCLFFIKSSLYYTRLFPSEDSPWHIQLR